VVAVYSTFMQRAVDQIIHDTAISNLPVVFAMDRAGLVGEDGPTHHGVFDIAFMKMVPNMTVMAPSCGEELRAMLRLAFRLKGPSSIRFPRGKAWQGPRVRNVKMAPGTSRTVLKGSGVTVLCLGTLLEEVIKAVEGLGAEYKGKIEVIDARFAKPLDEAAIIKSVKKTGKLITVEEGCIEGGFGMSVASMLRQKRVKTDLVKILAIPDRFAGQGTMAELRAECGLDAEAIGSAIIQSLRN
ncbi:MAG TPA: transketolase C-terminal domain-containing protein, partial [Candidatus Goldiibacteriota bacterium]|nr:transketolase C-terminal domain-containing protein [Candidatus Goldiibacteriota bacterium]